MPMLDLPLELIAAVGGTQAIVAFVAVFWSKRHLEKYKSELSASLKTLELTFQKELKQFEAELVHQNQTALQEQQARLTFETQLALHMAESRHDDESKTLLELWDQLSNLQRAGMSFLSAAANDRDGDEASLKREELLSLRKAFGQFRNSKAPLIPQSVNKPVDALIDMIASEAARSGKPVANPDLDRQGFILAMVRMKPLMDSVQQSIRAHLKNTTQAEA